MTDQVENQKIMAMLNNFIKLANEMKEQGNDVDLVNTALQMASGTYSTYLAAGNEGYLKDSGIDKITEAYKGNLTHLQEIKKRQLNPQGKD